MNTHILMTPRFNIVMYINIKVDITNNLLKRVEENLSGGNSGK